MVAWESQDAPGYTVDFVVSDGATRGAFVEVKSPGWESELTEVERRQGRAKRPKYSTNLHGRPAKPIEVIRRTLHKACPKFSGKAPSILIISDDCFINLGDFGYGPLQMALLQKSIAYGDGLFHKPEYSSIGAVCLFWWILDLQKYRIEYNSICMANPNATSKAAAPSEMVALLTTRRPREALDSRPREAQRFQDDA